MIKSSSVRQSLPDAPRGEGGYPIGLPCRPKCRMPGPSHAHCSVCHLTFASLGEFDRHRREGWCLDPKSLGLVDHERLWASPERHARDRVLSERLQEARFRGLQLSPERRTGVGGG